MSTSQNIDSRYPSIDGLNGVLTPAQILQFVQKAVPNLKLEKAALELSLENQQWKVATKQAHRLEAVWQNIIRILQRLVLAWRPV